MSKINSLHIEPTEQLVFAADNISWQVGEHHILNDISFQIKPKEFVGIIGPNGAGKSSLLRCLYGKNGITSGALKFKNIEQGIFTRRELAQQIAVVLQESPTHFDMTVVEIVSMGLIPQKALLSFSTESDKKIITQAILDVGLSKKAELPFNVLSGGEKQRVMLARAIVQKTEVLLLDEPTNHLDIQHQIEILHLVKSMNVTVLLSIHDLNMAAAFCDRLILMDQGKIVCQGSCEDVLTQKYLKQVFNVEASIDSHPYHAGQRISFDFNSQCERNND